MCGVKLKDRLPSKELRERLGIDDIALVLQQNRLRWYGHVLRKENDDWVKKCMEYEVDGPRQGIITVILSVCGHVDDIITSCAQSIQAMQILRAHGMAASTIHVIFNPVVVAKLTYAASSRLGFTTDEDRQRLAAVIRRGIRSGLCDPDHVSRRFSY